jgi:hypothetical protein
MPRKAHQPDPVARRQVEAMAAYGVPETDVARVLGIDPKTLRKHYREELDTGSIFWLKTRARWKETSVTEVNVAAIDPLTAMMQRIAENGRRIYDHEPIPRSESGDGEAQPDRNAARPPLALVAGG